MRDAVETVLYDEAKKTITVGDGRRHLLNRAQRRALAAGKPDPLTGSKNPNPCGNTRGKASRERRRAAQLRDAKAAAELAAFLKAIDLKAAGQAASL